jgi:hypothetical protein
MADFQQMKDTEFPWLPRNQDAFALLEGITAVDKALSQPYIKIWQVTSAGKPVHADPNDKNRPDPAKTISNLLVQPPQFGSSVHRFSERAPVALERVTVKNTFGKTGPITYRLITINFVVFQPERVFDESDDEFSEWWSLVLPGAYFMLRYGWTGTSANDLLNGNGIVDKNNIVEGTRDILFATTTWNFSINPDGSLSFVVNAIDQGNNILNHVHLADVDYFNSPNPQGEENITSYTAGGSDFKETRSPAGQKIIQKVQSDVHNLYDQKGSVRGKSGRVLKFSELLNGLYSPLMEKAVKGVGYDEARFYLGMFNKDIGSARDNCGGVMTGKSIGDFLIPESWFKDLLGFKRANGEQLNLMSVLTNVLNYICRQENWVGNNLSPDEKQQAEDASKENGKVNEKKRGTEEMKILRKRKSPPNLYVKTATHREKGKLIFNFYVYDLKALDAGFDFDDRLNPKTTRDDIHKKLKKYNFPLVSFKHGLSYIETANFAMETDANMQHIAIERAIDPNRYQTTGVPHVGLAAAGVDPRKLFLASNITGKVSMIGNFVWDTFFQIWCEFGVRRWDGPFYMMEKEDVIDASNFMSNVSLRATGEDPLNTQGVLKDNQHRKSS